VSTLYILFLLVIFLALNLLLRKGLSGLKGKTGVFVYIRRYFPVLELTFWSLFVVWAVNSLFEDSRFSLYVNFIIITLFFILIFWFFIRDYVSGVQIKSRFNLFEGQMFKSGQAVGSIRKLGLLFIELKSENGSDMKLPYSQIDQKSIELNFQEKNGGESNIKITLDGKLNETETSRRLTELIVNSPWSLHKSAPKIKISDSANGKKVYEISCFTIGDKGAKRIKELLNNELGGKE